MAQILSEQVQKRWNTQGIGEITPSAGLDVFGYLLQHENNQIGVLPIEWRKFLQQFPSGDEPTFLANIAQTIPKYQTSSSPSFNLWQQLQTATSNQREQLLIEHIRHEVAQVIGASPMILELQKGLFDLGMDSLMAVELKNRLQKSFGAALPSTLTFEYPTIEALKNYLSQEVLGWQDAPLLDENQSLTTKEEDHRTLLELEALSEDSAEILLAEKLALLEEMF
jgi:acyl carrier protein